MTTSQDNPFFKTVTKLVHFDIPDVPESLESKPEDQYRKTIARGYKKAKSAPWRRYCEEYTTFVKLGDIFEKSCLDMACGDGFYTRRLKYHGSGYTIGVDLSPEMISLAKQQESIEQLGIEYHCHDATTFTLPQEAKDGFDVVIASYLLNYATDLSILQKMCNAIGKCLKSGGKFVAINDNTIQTPCHELNSIWKDKWRKYGIAKQAMLEDELQGMRISYEIWLEPENSDSPSIQFNNFHHSQQDYIDCMTKAGLTDITFHPFILDPEALDKFPRDYWNDMIGDLTTCPTLVITATKLQESI